MGKSFKSCKECRQVYEYTGKDICYSCAQRIDGYFEKVREYLYNNPKATVTCTAEATGVDEKYILGFIRDGDLQMSVADGAIKCEKCGTPILTGSICEQCKKSLSEALNNVLSERKAQQEGSSSKDTGFNKKSGTGMYGNLIK